MSDSEQESRNSMDEAGPQELVGAALVQSIRESEKVLDEAIIKTLMERLSQPCDMKNIIGILESFAGSLISKIESLNQLLRIDIERGDYENLESAVQKAEAEIRNHIKIEQQLKIYMDGLEERLEELEKELKNSQNKYQKVFDTLRAVDAEKKELKKKLNMYEMKMKSDQSLIDQRIPAHKHSKVLSEYSVQESQSSLEKIYLDKGRATKVKSIAPKYSQKKQRMINSVIAEENSRKKKELKSELQISMVQLEVAKKQESNKMTTKQPTRTIRLREMQGKSDSKSGKLLQSDEGRRQKRDQRSSSVCT